MKQSSRVGVDDDGRIRMPTTFKTRDAVAFMKRTSLLALVSRIGLQLLAATAAVTATLAQTVPPEGPAPGGPASPVGTTGGGWAWLWILLVLAILAVAIWYGAKRRRG